MTWAQAVSMQTQKISYKRHRFPPQIIAPVVWLYVRFNLSLREVAELMLERGVDVSYDNPALERQVRPPDRPRSTATAAAPRVMSGIWTKSL
ncbi:MAG: hypothetical protein ACJAQU_001744 [Loktanella salsilacus]